ncbi:MAG: glycosyltransferase family 2 protein [Acidimicrobiales bacterium]
MTLCLSVVIPVHDGAHLLERQLDALATSMDGAPQTELIVVDNRSTDGSSTVATSWAVRHDIGLRVVEAAERPGEPYARNVGAYAAESDRIAFCDADDEVGPGWVEAMAAGLASSDYVTGPVDTVLLNEPWQVAMRSDLQRDRPATTYGGVAFAHGCNMGFRRAALLGLGGFDETFLIGCDVEIGVRAWRQKMQLDWLPDAQVHYRLRASQSEAYRQARAYGRSRARIRTLLADQVNAGAERRTAIRRAGWLLRHLPQVASPVGRARWVWVAGQVAGELGAIRQSTRP